MQMYSMHRRLDNSKVSVTSLHPGVVDTGLMRESQDSRFRQLAMGAVRTLGKLLHIHRGNILQMSWHLTCTYNKNGGSGIGTKMKRRIFLK